MPRIVEVSSDTLDVTHIFDGEEVVRGGHNGQVWVATFADSATANVFVKLIKQMSSTVKGLE